MITKLIIDGSDFENYDVLNNESGKNEKQLSNLSRVNIFIGENNSGKSRFLRKLFSNNNLMFETDLFDFKRFALELDIICKYIYEEFDINNDWDLEDIGKAISNLGPYTLNNFTGKIVQVEKWLKYLLPKINTGANVNMNISHVLNSVKDIVENSNSRNFEKIYVPILRGLRPIHIVDFSGYGFDVKTNSYQLRTTKDYFDKEKVVEKLIYTGLDLYDIVMNYNTDDKVKRRQIESFEFFLSETFFQSDRVRLIPHRSKDVLVIEIGDNDDRPIYDLGDGIQSLIIMLYPLFLNQGKNLLVFIEEPEISLHPGMQRIFIEALLRPEFESFQYFITTHSNHFLDITLDMENISIYTFLKRVDEKNKENFLIQNANNDDIRILDLIGVRNSSVFLSNCTIWVEGITDRLYLRKYLEVYQKDLVKNKEIIEPFKEDIHFSFVEYGGSNIVHWSFSDDDGSGKIKSSRISSKIFLVADKDSTEMKPDSEKAERLRLLKENLKEKFRVVDGWEIENTLSPCVIKKTIEEFQNKKLEEGIEGYQVDVTQLKIEEYKDVKLGTFIDANFPDLGRKYGDKYGTLTQKVQFCQTAIKKIESVDDLSGEGRKLAEDIFKFIQRNNPK